MELGVSLSILLAHEFGQVGTIDTWCGIEKSSPEDFYDSPD